MKVGSGEGFRFGVAGFRLGQGKGDRLFFDGIVAPVSHFDISLSIARPSHCDRCASAQENERRQTKS